MGILKNEKAFWERNERRKRAEALLKERQKDRDFAAVAVCYTLRTYTERASTYNWHRVNERLRAFDATESASDAARAAVRKIADEVSDDA